MTTFEILYAHLKAMNYKDAPLLVDSKLLFLNVGENYHILYLDDSLFVVDFVNSVIQHYRSDDKKLSVKNNRSIDYLRTLDKIPDTFLDLCPPICTIRNYLVNPNLDSLFLLFGQR